MIICTVVGNVWATRKKDELNGLKLMIVQRSGASHSDVSTVKSGDHSEERSFVAVDCVGAGIGEQVLVVTGSSARKALSNGNIPVDAVIVGIIDEVNDTPKE